MVYFLKSFKALKTDLSATKDLPVFFDSQFDLALEEIDVDSSPGKCYFAGLGSTNGEALGYKDGKFDPERIKELRCLVWQRMQEMLRTGEPVSDPINVFVKQEPHKLAKIEEGRERLISAVSLIDTMIDRVLFGWLMRVALQTVGRTPSMVGWTPLRGGWKLLRLYYNMKAVMCIDKKAWDWTLQGFMVEIWYQVLVALAVGAADWWLKLVKLRFKALFSDACVFEFSDGTQVQQTTEGVMKSGCFLTLILNTFSQSILHYIVCVRLGIDPMTGQPHVMGDDTVQEAVPDLEAYVREMEKLGAIIKGCKVQNWIEFAGFGIADLGRGVTCFPVYWQKHLYKLEYAELADVLISYQMLYANEPVMFGFLQELARRIDPTLVLDGVEAKAVMNESW